jgi:hypothetical protein
MFQFVFLSLLLGKCTKEDKRKKNALVCCYTFCVLFFSLRKLKTILLDGAPYFGHFGRLAFKNE